jgi:L-amino acid N-acyltransferase YncA
MPQDIDDIAFEFYGALSKAIPDVQQSIWSLLQLADKEFIPALSSRQGPKDTVLDHKNAATKSLPVDYFHEMSKQPVVVARLNGKVAGFMSYKTDYEVPETSEKVHAYVSTIIVNPAVRGRKMTARLYQRLFDLLRNNAQEYPILITTRTWSTNINHLTILRRLGFECIFIGKDGRGMGIDTVVYRLKLDRT